MKQQQRVAFRFSSQFGLQPVELKLTEFTVRDAEHLAVQQEDLPLFTRKNTFRRINPRILERTVHSGLKIVVTRQPDAGRAKARDAFSKMLVGRGRLVLRQIARCDNQIACTVFSVNGAKHRLITLPGVNPQ